MSVGRNARRALWKTGYDVTRFDVNSHPLARRKHLLDQYGVSLILDVGANVGQFGLEMRHIGYAGRIASFEPLSSAYRELANLAADDARWQTFPYALGNEDATLEINISANSVSSSLLEMLPLHRETAPDSQYVGVETAQVRALDGIFDDVRRSGDSVYLKIDTQGFEKQVLAGAHASLPQIATLQIELSLAPLYEGGSPFIEMIESLEALGYSLVGVEPGFTDPASGRMLQLDGVFHRFPE